MQLGLLIGLTRLRVALMIAGLAFFMGLTAPLGIRVLLLALIVAAVVFDGAVEDQRTKKPAATSHDDYRTAA
ncbi:hypothetical protein [Streptomyces nigrescens]|uniref:Uncharacterized protein n=1 Tax=Streptomyces nigrescens TaxID=1920 RepID=A0A640T8J3_STRNI|nr:hypothetical protein [Streptomyces libani]WAT94910.1 hypothetical protein STRLI_000582 [Streptomyces libani subsp. libani]GFE20059.1 hypothetical protein Sliba_05120 [Streptomyces libani subsp. libani]GGV85708.1 hypothetical protein GCM10010500_02650 [Streptomyces libani subsp. libani]